MTGRCAGSIPWSRPGARPTSGMSSPSPSLTGRCRFTSDGTFPDTGLRASMNITVLGLWHLGSVTAACLARHHRVTGLDFDEPVLAKLRTGHAPLHEPGLDELLAAGLAKGNLSFSDDTAGVATADVLWVCFDTPVDADDRS